ncbi:MAG: Gfo/Idh/MocA family oxidoreductase [Gemmatimonadota bacterium]
MTTGEVKAARVAVLGAGAIAQVVHLPILTRMRGAQLVGLCDVDQGKAATLAQRFGVSRTYGSAEELWSDEAIDAVIVCTPSSLHEQQVIDGLGGGKYVFCEKPLALTAEGTARVLATEGARNRLMVGMNQRFRPDAAALKSAVSNGQLGEVRFIRAGWLNRRAGKSAQGWRHEKQNAGGGALMDLGIQMLDLSLWVLDYPEPTRLVSYLHTPDGGEVEDSAILVVELDGGRVVNLEVTWTFVADRERQYLQVIGSGGSAGFPPLKIFTESSAGLVDASPELPPGRENQFTASYRQELGAFVEAVRGEQPIETPSEQTTLMRIVEAAYRSADESGEIHF